MKINNYSKEELKEMYESGRIAKCVSCGTYVEIEYKFPYYNQTKCNECKTYNHTKKHFNPYEMFSKMNNKK